MNKINTSLAVLAISLGLSANAMADNTYKSTDKNMSSETRSGSKSSVGNEIDDTVLTTKVKSALLSEPAIKSFDIAVETHKGEVQLSGFVDNNTQAKRAVQVAYNIEGVKSVINKMSVKQ